ncbi:MAG: hypothetical protein ACO1NW_01285 [Chitinophagaceae bacterium]
MSRLLLVLLFSMCTCVLRAQTWQWSVSVDSAFSSETNDHPRAFLWIPENCQKVKGVVFAQHNMVEEGMLERPVFRETLSDLGFAEVWVTPIMNMTFDFNKDAAEDFQRMMDLLAIESGYEELSTAPVVPLGHSALASFPWNFAAWNPARTLAVVSVHGDVPLTPLTGSGKPNPDWGNSRIDGVPGLFIMGEFEWWEDRIQPGFRFLQQHPGVPITFLADAGRGHFDYSNQMVEFVCMFIKKAAAHRLPKKEGQPLKHVSPQKGWLTDRWRKDSLPLYPSATYAQYTGNKWEASFCFDKEMAQATNAIYKKSRGKINQFIGFEQHGQILPMHQTHGVFQLPFQPQEDGISFHLKAFFADSLRVKIAPKHAASPLTIDKITGPVEKVNDTSFRISFSRTGFNNAKRSNDIWLIAANDGDDTFKSSVQQINMRFPLFNKEGAQQTILFEEIADVPIESNPMALKATSSSKLPVSFYVREGPASINGNTLTLSKIPPRTKFPVKVTVVAWQYGIKGKLQSAIPVERSFFITKR